MSDSPVPIVVPVLNPPRNPADGDAFTGPEPPVQFLQWLVDSETPVSTGERIAELLTPGIVFHISAPTEGLLRHHPIRPGTTVRPGDLLGTIQSESWPRN